MMTAMAGVLGATQTKYVLDDIVTEYANNSLANPIAGAFSLRRLRAGYSNSVCRIRHFSNNSEANVNLSGDRVTLSSEVIVLVKGTSSFTVFDRVSLSTFLGGASAVCIALYDQSGKGRFLDSRNASNSYPLFSSNGSLYTIGNIPVLAGNGTAHLYGSLGTRNNSTLSTFALLKKGASDAAYARYISGTVSLGADNNTVTSFNFNVTNAASSMTAERTSLITPKSLTNNETAVFSCIWDGTNSNLRKNNDSPQILGSTGNFTFDQFGILGTTYGSSLQCTGQIGDTIVFDAALSATNRQNLEREIGKAYGITVA